MSYTNGSNTCSNADPSLTTGTGLGGDFGSLSVIANRTWNGTIDYSLTSATPEPSSFALVGVAFSWVFFRRTRA